MSKFIVYCTTCTVNNKIYVGVHKVNDDLKFDGYIGCGVYIKEPSTYNKAKTVFQRAVQKYGTKNFIRKTLAIFDNEEDAYFLEETIVTKEFISREDVYNSTIGGQGGDRGINSKPCYQYDLLGNFIKEFPNRQEAAREVGRGFTTIKRAIKEKVKAGNWFWADEKVDKLDLTNYKTSTNRIPVFEYDINGTYNCCYESFADAARCNNISTSSIREAALCGTICNNKKFSLEFSETFSDSKLLQLKNFPVFIYKITGEFIQEAKDLKEAKSILKARCDLFKYIRLNTPYKNYQLSFEKLDKMPDKSIKKPAKRKIAQYDKDDVLIQIFDSVSDAVKIYGTGVKHCLSGRNHFSKGFTYKYIDC